MIPVPASCGTELAIIMVCFPEVDALVFASSHNELAIMTEAGPDLAAEVRKASVLAVLAVLIQPIESDATVIASNQHLRARVII